MQNNFFSGCHQAKSFQTPGAGKWEFNRVGIVRVQHRDKHRSCRVSDRVFGPVRYHRVETASTGRGKWWRERGWGHSGGLFSRRNQYCHSNCKFYKSHPACILIYWYKCNRLSSVCWWIRLFKIKIDKLSVFGIPCTFPENRQHKDLSEPLEPFRISPYGSN